MSDERAESWFGCFTGDCPHATRAECDAAIRAEMATLESTVAALDAERARIHGVTWVLLRHDRATGETSVLLERCPKKARVLGVGEWFVPGGKIEGNETPDAALRREIGEEWPGAEIVTASPLPILEGSPVPPGPRGLFLMRPYLVTVSFDRAKDGTAPDVSADGVELRWTPVGEALASPVAQVRMMIAAALYPSRALDITPRAG